MDHHQNHQHRNTETVLTREADGLHRDLKAAKRIIDTQGRIITALLKELTKNP